MSQTPRRSPRQAFGGNSEATPQGGKQTKTKTLSNLQNFSYEVSHRRGHASSSASAQAESASRSGKHQERSEIVIVRRAAQWASFFHKTRLTNLVADGQTRQTRITPWDITRVPAPYSDTRTLSERSRRR